MAEDDAAEGFRVFLSYRRADSSGHAGRIYDGITNRHPDWQVFIDVDTIEPGVDFVDVVEDAVGSCDVLVAVIGKSWLNSDTPTGPRMHDERDFVRLEIDTALQRQIRVIPVLVQGAQMPSTDDLPDGTKALARRNAIELSDLRWRHDVDQLIAVLEDIFARKQPESAPPPKADGIGSAPLGSLEETATEPKTRTVSRLLAGVAGGLVLVVAGVGVALGLSGGKASAGTYAVTASRTMETLSSVSNGVGKPGAPIANQQEVQVSCRMQSSAPNATNEWWYRISSAPWDGNYWVNAAGFRTPASSDSNWFDSRIPVCGSGGTGGASAIGATSGSGGSSETTTTTASTPTPQGAGSNSPGSGSSPVGVKSGGSAGSAIPSGAPATANANGIPSSALGVPATTATTVPLPTTLPVPATTTPASTAVPAHMETAGGNASTWANYANAGGHPGATIAALSAVQVSCKVIGYKVQDGNTFWYRIASSPWDNVFYVSADAFYNNGQTSGSLLGTPYVDPSVPDC